MFQAETLPVLHDLDRFSGLADEPLQLPYVVDVRDAESSHLTLRGVAFQRAIRLECFLRGTSAFGRDTRTS